MRADRTDQALAEQRARADGLQERIEDLLSQVGAAEADAKAANDRAWTSGEVTGGVREQLAATERRYEAERKRAERAEKMADRDREQLLNAESKTWRTLAALEAADKQTKQLQTKLAAAEAAAATAWFRIDPFWVTGGERKPPAREGRIADFGWMICRMEEAVDLPPG
jgi:chromosome segregation ATPase